jgi:hypothetical protein
MTMTHKFSKVSGFTGDRFHTIGYRFEGTPSDVIAGRTR